MDRASTTRALVVVALIWLCSLAGSVSAQSTPTSAEDIPAALAPPTGSVLLFALGARGVQIYECEAKPDDVTTFVWTFKAPEAELLNERGEVVGRHFAGPTWQGSDGSAVVAAGVERADAPQPGAIPWLLLEAKEHSGSGAFSAITYIQRLATAGGVAPTEGCDEAHAGEEAREPYEATYAFYYPAVPATPGATSAEQTGSVTILVFRCPPDLRQTVREERVDQAMLLAACTPFESPTVAPTLQLLPDGETKAGTTASPGAYRWDNLALGDYVVGGNGEMPADLASLLVTDVNGAPLQNPTLCLDSASPHVEYRYYYFVAEATPAASPAP